MGGVGHPRPWDVGYRGVGNAASPHGGGKMYRSHYLGPFPRETLSIRETQKRAKRRDRHEQGARDHGPTAQAPREARLPKAPRSHLDHGRPAELARAGKTGGGLCGGRCPALEDKELGSVNSSALLLLPFLVGDLFILSFPSLISF